MTIRLIGVDGGATCVRAYRFDPRTLETLAPGQERSYRGNFRALPLEVQRAGAPLTAEEEREGLERVAAAAEVVSRLAQGDGPLVVGVALAGLKDRRRRGVVLARNGPRIPGFLDRFQEELRRLGTPPSEPVPPLGDDGELAGLGEEHAPRGNFSGVANAYYLGSGTGLSEAVKLDGQVGELPAWLPRAWQLGFEDGLKAAAILESYRARCGRPEAGFDDLGRAAPGELRDIAERLARLLEDRAGRLRERGLALERLVLGQRFRELNALAAFFPPGFAIISELVEAPAVGAAARAARCSKLDS
ncbi:MAG: hypothetical protein HY319_12735 [Armatimonadetes bacterium]|nr:hypothetical protein [Armatimonadota bacterium]